mmetsp:Transcript_14771/g.32100  ORF Transcript_14771/g.32100 Transcript_14771/m.32100 type:complete len:243 (-) Transcript_14771:1152-1880(-)|eukprot:CAMPEP_0172321950 /NCGR_PEP_ID=MMETSP1058-20130122/44719_1 /TAXON_ID=83371 /ORGANISM="Detonula confervacea, Strain CCMP 353" /LENGTH=242 /DNA_ID=CAMNT_0013037577 /DNA_START=33 /DNA_END=761 /DNA_ORIENTATION=-
MTAVINPSFEPPNNDSDTEIWLLRAPAALDVSALLNGVTLDVDPQSLQLQSSSSTSNNILSIFKSDESEYALALGDANESVNLRLLVPDKSNSDGNELLPYHRPFQRQIHLTSVMSCQGANNAGDTSNVQADLVIAPSKDVAPKPAFGQSGNGSVDAMRDAYVPIPQRQGLKRRWVMPGSKIADISSSALHHTPKKALVGDVKKEAVVSDDEQQKSVAKSSSKKDKKDKKKKEKKSKKSPKK